MTKENNQELMTFGGHLEVLRRMLFRILAIVGILSTIIFKNIKNEYPEISLRTPNSNFLKLIFIFKILME